MEASGRSAAGHTSPPSFCVAITWALEPCVFSRHPTSTWKSHVAPSGTGDRKCGAWVRANFCGQLSAGGGQGRDQGVGHLAPPSTPQIIPLRLRSAFRGRTEEPLLLGLQPEHVAMSPVAVMEGGPSEFRWTENAQSTWDFRARPGKRMSNISLIDYSIDTF